MAIQTRLPLTAARVIEAADISEFPDGDSCIYKHLAGKQVPQAYHPAPLGPCAVRALRISGLAQFVAALRPLADYNSHLGPRLRQKVDQGIDAKTIDLSPYKVTDSWLRNAEQSREFGLCMPRILHPAFQFNHERRTQLQARRFGRFKSKIGKDVVASFTNGSIGLIVILSFGASG